MLSTGKDSIGVGTLIASELTFLEEIPSYLYADFIEDQKESFEDFS